MKAISISFSAGIIFALVTDVLAQPFNYSSFTIGQVRTINCDTAGVSEGSAGTNVAWAPTVKPRDTSVFSAMKVTPASTPYVASFPTATDAITNQGGMSQFFYYRIAGDSLIFLGFADSLRTLVYTNPQLSALRSLSYGQSFTDTYGYVDTTTLASVKFISKVDATKTVTFDGMGTLALPWQTFSHALRFKTVTSQTDSTFFGALFTSGSKTDITTYSWLDTTLPVNTGFSISKTTTTSTVATTTSTVVSYTAPVPVHTAQPISFVIDNKLSGMTVSPVSNAHVRIWPNANIGNLTFTAYSLSGKVMATAEGNADVFAGNGAGLSAPLGRGVYLYSVKGENRVLNQGKMVIR